MTLFTDDLYLLVQVQNGILRIQLVREEDRGVYYCEAENSAGTDYATVTIEIESKFSADQMSVFSLF